MISGNRDEAWPMYLAWPIPERFMLGVIWWHVTCMLSLAGHWQDRRALSNHVCAHSVIPMWHVVCLQHLARASSEQSRSTTVLPINHVIQIPQCLSGFVNHDYLWAFNLTHCGLVTHYGDIVLGKHWLRWWFHYSDVIMGAMLSQITCGSIVYSTICSGANQRKHQGPASLAFVRGIHRWPVNSPHKMTVTRKMFPFDDVIMFLQDVTKPLPEPMFIYHK